MEGLMMDYQLNVPAILRRSDELYGGREIVSRLPDKSWHRFTYADFVSRTKRLAVALRGLGLDDGDRVATLMWNHHEHAVARVRGDVRVVVGVQAEVQRVRDEAAGGRADVRLEVLVVVPHQRGDAVAVVEPEAAQRDGEALGA